MDCTIEKFLVLIPEKNKEKIKQWLKNKEIQIDSITLNEMVYSISTTKQLLNEEIEFCSKITEPTFGVNLKAALINAKENKIEKLIDTYNSSNTYNKTKFNEKNEINFDKITTIKKMSLEIENFDYEVPISIKAVFTTHDGEIISKNIIPFNFNGLYKELISTNEFSTSKFKVANKDNIYFYTCDYGEGFFIMGKEIKLTLKKDYDFDINGNLVFLGNRLAEQKLIIMYHPNENAYEIDINKKLLKVSLETENDFIGYLKNKIKRMVIK